MLGARGKKSKFRSSNWQKVWITLPVCLWINLKPIFYNPKQCNLCCNLDISMTFSLSELGKDKPGKGKPGTFLDDVNSFNNNITFTHKSSKENVTVLDLMVKLSQYLHFNSSHSDHTICFTRIKNLKRYFNQDLWHRCEVSKNLRTYSFRTKLYPMESKAGSCKCTVKGDRYVSVYLERKYLPTQ